MRKAMQADSTTRASLRRAADFDFSFGRNMCVNDRPPQVATGACFVLWTVLLPCHFYRAHETQMLDSGVPRLVRKLRHRRWSWGFIGTTHRGTHRLSPLQLHNFLQQ
jgi:hypothetical protein